MGAGTGCDDLAKKARAWVAREMDKAGTLQIKPGQRGMEFGSARVIAPRMSEFAGDLLEDTYLPKTQVDLGAHCVGAMIKILRNALLQ